MKKQPPSTALAPQRAATGVLAKRPDLAADVARYIRASRSKASWRALTSDERIFRAWCEGEGVSPLPATEDTVAAFMAAQIRAGKSLATVLRYRASISTLHKFAKLPNPAYTDQIRETVKGIRSEVGVRPRHAKEAFTSETGFAAFDTAAERTATEIRDRALLLVGLASAMRRSELCALRVEDLTWQDAGVVAMINRSKTDQAGEGRAVAIPRRDGSPLCPVAALHAWLRWIDAPTQGPLFRPLTRGGRALPRALDPQAVARAVKHAARVAGIDPKTVGAHSLRAGYVTEARRAGLDWGSIMQQTGHRKVETAMRYDRGGASVFKLTSAEQVFAAFDESRQLSWPAEVVALADALRAGGVKVTRVTLPPVSLGTSKHDFAGEGSEAHRRLCLAAARWLEGHGRPWTADPARRLCAGGVADVATKDGRLFVEAGGTNAGKVIACLRAGQEVLLVPYALDGVAGLHLVGTVPTDPVVEERLRAAAGKLAEAFK